MEIPIFEGLKKYIEEKNISFHTPGHKGKNTLVDWGKYIPQIDLTEVEGLDNLHDPRGIILESQSLAAKTFKAKKTLYSVNGTTGGIHIALAAATNPGEKILIQRNSHSSVYKGAILNRLGIEYIYPNYNKKYNLLTGIKTQDVESILMKDSKISAVVITYPSYYGICSDLEKIAEIVHKYDKILIVDEAHGSHFIFSNRLPKSSLELGADIVVQSTHKTLPSFTQTSMIHCGSHRIDIEKLEEMFNLYQTTSPSYLFMASLDIARAYMDGEGRDRLDEHLRNIEEMVNKLNNINGVFAFTGDEEDETISDFDKTKVPIRLKNIRGTTLESLLRKKYNIQLEMSDYYYGLLLTTLMNSYDELNLFEEAILNLATIEPLEEMVDFDFEMNSPKIEIPLDEAFYKKKEVVGLRESVGRICGNYIIPYPPGIPLIVPGELITSDICEKIEFLRKNNVEIVGLLDYNKEKIVVVK